MPYIRFTVMTECECLDVRNRKVRLRPGDTVRQMNPQEVIAQDHTYETFLFLPTTLHDWIQRGVVVADI